MAEFVNLYEQLELDPALSCQEMETELKKLRKKWKSRQNAPTLEVRQEAELKCKLIEEALDKLTDENKRTAYDYEVRQHKNRKADPGPVRESENAKPLDFDDVESIIEVCRQLVEEDNANELYRLTSNAIKHGIENDGIFFFYGWACYYFENYTEAEKAYKMALELSPNHAFYTYKYAELLLGTKRYEEAKELLFELYHNGQDNIDVVTGLIRCLFELDQEPMASKIIAEYIGKNPTSMAFKRSAQKEYLNAILRVKSTYLYSNPNQEQIETMYAYAQKANSILPNNRSKEALEEIGAMMPKGGFSNRSGERPPKNTPVKKDSATSADSAESAASASDTGSSKKNLNLFSILSIVLAFLYPLAGFIFAIITIKQARDPRDIKYRKRGIAAIVIFSIVTFLFYVLPIIIALL